MKVSMRTSGELDISCRFIYLLLGFMLFAITGCSGSLSADVTPPPDYQPTLQIFSNNPAVVDISPLLPPDPIAGKDVYKDNCAPCHGLTGMGDGERVSSLPVLPPPLGSLNYSRKISPTIWFQTVTQGKIEKLMPGFGSNLSDRQRWDVVAYLLSLGITSEQSGDGERVFWQYCQSCHGLNAREESGQAPDLTESKQLQKSLDELVAIISQGKGSMPALGESLSKDQELNTSIYLRSLVFANPDSNSDLDIPKTQEPPTSNAIQTGQPVPELIISGRVINGSGGTTPSDLQVELTGYDSTKTVFSLHQPVREDGGFTFQQVPEESGWVYLLSVTYKGIFYTSDSIQSGLTEELQNQIITIYEPGTDISLVKAQRMHIFFEFPKENVIRIVQLYILSNPSNFLVTASLAGNPVIVFPLPSGAANLQFEGGTLGQRFVLTPDGFGDTRGISPGTDTQVLFSFELPYKTDLLIPIKIPIPVDTINIMLPSSNVSVKSSQLQDLGEKSIQNTAWHVYTSSSLAAGSRLDLLVSGKPRMADPEEDELNTNLAVGVISISIVLFFVFIFVFQKISFNKSQKTPVVVPTFDEENRDSILDAIIALDDQHQAGQIPPAAYQERRAELKDRLRGIQP